VCVGGVCNSPHQLIYNKGVTYIQVLWACISDNGTIRGYIKRALTSFSTRDAASGSLVMPPSVIMVRTPTKSWSCNTDATRAFVVGVPSSTALKLVLKS